MMQEPHAIRLGITHPNRDFAATHDTSLCRFIVSRSNSGRETINQGKRPTQAHSPSPARPSPVFSVRAPHHRAGFLVVVDFFRLRIEMNNPPHTRGDVAEMTQRRGQMPNLDVSCGPIAVADAIEEVPL